MRGAAILVDGIIGRRYEEVIKESAASLWGWTSFRGKGNRPKFTVTNNRRTVFIGIGNDYSGFGVSVRCSYWERVHWDRQPTVA